MNNIIIMEEIWKDITGYEGLYQVSNLGRVKSLEKTRGRGKGHLYPEKILKGYKKRSGYIEIDLRKNGKSKKYKVHRLVAIHFCEGYKEGLVVMHINNIKDDNRSCNLQWGTHSENTKQAVNDGLVKPPINGINRLVLDTETGIFYNSIQEAYDAKYSNIISYTTIVTWLNPSSRWKNKSSLIYAD